METESKEGLEKEVTNLFGKILRARVADSRIIEGEFQCVDKDLNVVLSCASEYHAVEDITFETTDCLVRNVGMAIIPGHVIESILLIEESQE